MKRLVKEIREILSPEKCLSVELHSGDYMDPQHGGLTQDEALEQVRCLIECGMVDFMEISGGNAEQKTSKLQNSFGGKSLEKAPKRESTRIREAAFTEFAERVESCSLIFPFSFLEVSGAGMGWQTLLIRGPATLSDLVGQRC